MAAARSLFLAYLEQARDLSARPRFYDTLTANCTTIVYQMAQRIVGGLPLDWRRCSPRAICPKIDGFSAKQDLATLQTAGRIYRAGHRNQRRSALLPTGSAKASPACRHWQDGPSEPMSTGLRRHRLGPR